MRLVFRVEGFACWDQDSGICGEGLWFEGFGMWGLGFRSLFLFHRDFNIPR